MSATAATIGTHNGSFHADEVLACAMLQVLPQYSQAKIVRTRDATVLDTCDIVVDVGGEFDPGRHRYDHHQKTFTHTMQSLNPALPWVTKLSSAGLVYFHFGHAILAQLLGEEETSQKVKRVYEKVYSGFVEEIDAIDNGISTHDGEGRYTINTNLSRRVGNFSPRWNDPEQDFEAGFFKAKEMVFAEFKDKVEYYGRSWYPARSLVEEALEARFQVDPSGRVLELRQGGVPWKEHLFQLEEEKGLTGDSSILYVIYTDQNSMWRVQCVPLRSSSFENRLSLPEAWRGVRDADLESVSGMVGATFVHASGFIGGNKTRDGVMDMVKFSLKQLPA